jgi:HAD superfamily hydrolase (TIGR01509 family)
MPAATRLPAHSTLGIVFDFDGVIADTERVHLCAFREALAVRGWTIDESAYFDRYLGYDDRGLVAAYARDQHLDLDDAAIQLLMQAKTAAFARHLGSANMLFPGAKARISELASSFPLAIASGSTHAEIETILSAAALLDSFSVIVGTDDVAASKPSPDSYLLAAGTMGLAPSACVAVEDSATGLEAARAAGMRTIAITSTSPRRALALADRVIDGLAELTPDLVAAVGAPRGLW